MERMLREKLIGGKFNNVSPSVSKMMAAIKSTKTKTTEMNFQAALINAGITNFCINANLPGHPDIYFPSYGIVVFLDGCFWHGCPRCGHIPKSNTLYWRTKIERNIERDSQKRTLLGDQGYKIVQYWEHELKENLPECITKLENVIEDCLMRVSSYSIDFETAEIVGNNI